MNLPRAARYYSLCMPWLLLNMRIANPMHGGLRGYGCDLQTRLASITRIVQYFHLVTVKNLIVAERKIDNNVSK